MAFGADGRVRVADRRCGVCRDSRESACAARFRSALMSSLARPSCISRERPLPNTAATPAFEPPAGRLGPEKLDETASSTTAATARLPAAAATIRRSSLRGLRGGRRVPAVPTVAGSSAGAWSALWIAADRSPQKSSALGGGSSTLDGDASLEAAPPAFWEVARGPKGTSSSRGPSQSRGRRTTVARG